MSWIAPEFAAYPLGAQYTAWVYGDAQSNPEYWNQPDKWPNTGMIAQQDREVVFTNLASGVTPFLAANTQSTSLKLTGGKNCVVFARYVAFGVGGGSITQQLPTQLGAYIWVRQALDEGYLEIEDTRVVNVFGYGWAPHKFPAPITWNDKLLRTLTLSNVSGISLSSVTIGFKTMYLNTGA
jgi:hypothetical protein